nr:putative ORF1 [Marmot picobirnavirus]AVX53743.1 putative ORF1 [Marmot picobirnavirus]
MCDLMSVSSYNNYIQEGGFMTRNQLTYWANKEQARNNRIVAAETNRSNLARETETNRHNLAMEQKEWEAFRELARHNQATEAQAQNELLERGRANRAGELLQKSSIGLGYANLGLGYSQLTEQARSNRAREYENMRSNMARERQNWLDYANDTARNRETGRHNQVAEQQNQQRISNDFALGIASTAEKAVNDLGQLLIGAGSKASSKGNRRVQLR